MSNKFLTKSLLSLFLLVLSNNSFADVDCSIHKIYCAIVKLQPNVEKAWAMELSDHIYSYSRKHNIDPMLSVAILMKESSARAIHREKKGFQFVKECDTHGYCKTVAKLETVYPDIGPLQFHWRTVTNYKIDPVKVHEGDLEYIVKSHYKILAAKLVDCKHLGDEAWSCYHDARDKFRIPYMNQVKKFYKKIAPHKTSENLTKN